MNLRLELRNLVNLRLQASLTYGYGALLTGHPYVCSAFEAFTGSRLFKRTSMFYHSTPLMFRIRAYLRVSFARLD